MTRFATALTSLGLDPELSRSLSGFVELFARWNASINLSAARTTPEIEEHVLDCLQAVSHVEGERLIDVGSGGGFPAAILAICLPSLRVVALEPVHKKH